MARPAPSLPTRPPICWYPTRRDAVPTDELRGRVVFVGFQELDIPQAPDSFPTAFRSADGVDLAGVEIAATAFGNLLHDETLRALARVDAPRSGGGARLRCSRWPAAWERSGAAWR